MKRRVKTQPSNAYYTTEPAVSRKAIAAQPMVPSSSLSNTPNRIVPKHPGRMSGMAGFTSKNKPHTKPSGISIPKVGATPKQPAKLTVKKPTKTKV
jgi:hypothetical protein